MRTTPGYDASAMAFTVGGNMAAGVSHDDLLVRLSPQRRARRTGVRLMEIGLRTSRGFLSAAPGAITTDKKLHAWVDRGVAFASSLPPKKPKPKKTKPSSS